MATWIRHHERMATVTSARIRGVVFDLDGVLRHFDSAPSARIEAEYGLDEGTIARIAFAPELLIPAISGTVSDEAWRASIATSLGTTTRTCPCPTSRRVLVRVTWANRPRSDETPISDSARPTRRRPD